MTERKGYYLDAETIANQQEHIKQLEAQVRELARENAELKQVPKRSGDSPRCPLRDSMTGEMGVCDKRCAWLMQVRDSEQYHACAAAIIARNVDSADWWTPANYWNEVD